MKRPGKKRLDTLLLERGLSPSRSAAVGSILSGRVYSGHQRLDKPGTQLDIDVPLRLLEPPRYVSRGGYKLEGALAELGAKPQGLVWIDVGSSTGGFTDCLLQNGAKRVYAVDVGKGLLDQKLRDDERVIVREGENARYLRRDSFDEAIAAASVDASFIGLSKLLPALCHLLAAGGQLLAMIKPQFEAGADLARRHAGVIRDPDLRSQIVDGVVHTVAGAGFCVLGRCDSKLAGPKGNLEHFVWARKTHDH